MGDGLGFLHALRTTHRLFLRNHTPPQDGGRRVDGTVAYVGADRHDHPLLMDTHGVFGRGGADQFDCTPTQRVAAKILATYASMAGILADEQVSGHPKIAPDRIVSSAEVLSPSLRQRIQAVWGDIVFDQYGASEGGTFAVECESPYRAIAPVQRQHHDASTRSDRHRRGLHVFEDLYILEVVDSRNRPVAPGQYGDKVLLTVLFNYSQPLIRYELSDRIRMSTKRCSCGSAVRPY